MAWGQLYNIPFKSRVGYQYEIRIFGWNYDGSPTQLTAAANPIETQEADTSDIFTPARVQTGYVRVIDTSGNGTLLASLVPSNNTQRLVQLVRGTYSGTWPNGYFIPDQAAPIAWQGFMCAEAFSQKWDSVAKQIDLPVKSLLSALEDVTIPVGSASSTMKIAKIFTDAFSYLHKTPEWVVVASTLYDVPGEFFLSNVQAEIFFTEETVSNQGDSYTEMIGCSYLEALSNIAALFGLSIREKGDVIYITQYDKNGGNLKKSEYSWSQMLDMSLGTAPQSVTYTDIPDYDLLSTFDFRGEDNKLGFVQGGKAAKVTVAVNTTPPIAISLPQTVEDQSEVYQVNCKNWLVNVQPHPPRTGGNETFTYSEYRILTKVGSATYQDCLLNTVIFDPLFDPNYNPNNHIYTGAFPCRWSAQRSASDNPTLQNGLFLHQQYLKENQSMTPDYCYAIQSQLAYTLRDGYIRINFNLYNFMKGILAGDVNDLFFGLNTYATGPVFTRFRCILTFGNYHWNGTSWVETYGTYQTFTIPFKGQTVNSNKTTEMNFETDGGWFVPVTSQMTGHIKLYILNVTECETDFGFANAHSRIITDLSVEWCANASLVVSHRTSNVYRQTIMTTGFKEDKDIDLSVGTWNNNMDSSSFLKTSGGDFLQTVKFASGGSYISERPELMLLSRMAAQYNQVRRTLQAVVSSGLDLLTCRYTYQNRKFQALDYRHDWIDDEQTVKLLEVT